MYAGAGEDARAREGLGPPGGRYRFTEFPPLFPPDRVEMYHRSRRENPPNGKKNADGRAAALAVAPDPTRLDGLGGWRRLPIVIILLLCLV